MAEDTRPETAQAVQEDFNPYDLGDTQVDDVVDSVVETKGPARGPDGKFVSVAKTDSVSVGHKHSSGIVRMASDLGLSADEIAETSPETLENLVYHLGKEQLRLAREIAKNETLTAQGKQAPAEQVQEDDFGFDTTDYDQNVIGVLKSQAKELKELKGQLAQFNQHAAKRAQESVNVRCDRAFEKYKDILGAGKGSELAPDDPSMIRRKAVLQAVDAMGQRPGTLEEKIDKVMGILYPERAASKAARHQEWDDGGLARPTQRNGSPELPGKKKAAATVARILRESDVVGDTDEDGFL